MSHNDNPAIERKAIRFELKSVSDDGYGSFEGLGGCFNILDAGGDIIAPGAFRDGLTKFLTDGFLGGVDHDWSGAIGHPARAEETPEGLLVKGMFDDTPAAQAVRSSMTPNPVTGRATIKSLSIGYRSEAARYLDGPDECKAYWAGVGYAPTDRDVERSAKGARLLTKIALYEVSPVLVPMNDGASVRSVKSQEQRGFDEQATMVATTVAGFVGRAKSRVEARAKSGRVLSESNRTKLTALVASLREAMTEITALLDATEPAPKGGKSASADDAPSVPKSEPEPVVVPAIDEAEVYRQYALTMHRTNPAMA